ncbi:uncharacterized protein BDZ99DRAFT_457623 [Mytilinidion resinicola]|uniref:Uncharacterized protein n=1 Tax=Mytilinidion resinicola TaxID=574789 RepID=A0A6A6Z5S1_9PEZI|nr:uncharacterized protein BDZ99DRAFT_457623 [Mytilinidion resinicola]KAF2815644.1 hypothetical protein BDZ99DRAFT_457623 [Mytilinidion resinicola]
MAPEDSNMAWITWSQNPFPGGENGPVFQFFQKLVTAGDLHVNNCYLPGARDHRAVYELAHIATMTASNPNPRDRYNGLQDYDVIEYASQNALVDAITRYTFTQPVTPLMSHAFAEYVENLHEEEYPSDRLETILARYGINAWAPDELEDEEPYWEQYPPQIHPTIREGTLVPNYLLRDPETGAFRQDEGYTYARWGGDGWVILPTPAGVVEATAAGMAEAAPDGMAEVNDVGVGEATAVGRDEATRAGAQEEEEESEDLNELLTTDVNYRDV